MLQQDPGVCSFPFLGFEPMISAPNSPQVPEILVPAVLEQVQLLLKVKDEGTPGGWRESLMCGSGIWVRTGKQFQHRNIVLNRDPFLLDDQFPILDMQLVKMAFMVRLSICHKT